MQLNNLGIEGVHIELVDIDDITDAGYVNSIDLSVDVDSTFCLNDGIISHNSALGTVVSGLSVVGRDYYGAYPIRGRILNVRNVKSLTEIGNSELIANLMKIIGLIPGKKYTSLKELRYGKLIFFTDADDFGLSIKGLLINFIHKMWPELIKLGICYEFITPIVKATKNKKLIEYYSLQKYHDDVQANKLTGYKIKYYKGLGTINSNEIKDMFKNLDKHLIQFKYNNDDDLIDMVFNGDRVQERKEWLIENQIFKDVPDKSNGNNITDFINTEFVQFAHYDNIISIPKFEDGLKPSQRKIIFGAFKRNLKTTSDGEIKVAQFGSFVAEKSHFNHGECLSEETIINMADGTQITIGDWYNNHKNEEFIIRTVDDKTFNNINAYGQNVKLGKKTTEFVKIYLDETEYIECTPEHLFLTDKGWVQAKDIDENTNLIVEN